jgi:hypothetical protein
MFYVIIWQKLFFDKGGFQKNMKKIPAAKKNALATAKTVLDSLRSRTGSVILFPEIVS